MLNNKPLLPILPVEDMSRAKDFYENMLEFRVHMADEMPGYAFVEGETGAVEILLYEREKTKADHTVLTFLVENLKDEMNQLRDKGIEFEQYAEEEFQTDINGVSSQGSSKAAWFKDSEDNILAITEFTDIEEDIKE